MRRLFILSIALLTVSWYTERSLMGQTDENQKPECGMASLLKKKTRPGIRPPSTPSVPDPRKSQRETQRGPVRKVSDRAAAIKQRIEELKKTPYDKIDPVRSAADAKKQIAELKKRRADLGKEATAKKIKNTVQIGKKSSELSGKWSNIAEKFLDGKKRTSREWRDLYKKVIIGDSEGSRKKDSPKTESGAAESTSPKGTPEAKDQSENGTKVKKEALKPADFVDLKKAFADNSKPPSMPGALWALLLDRFNRDLSKLETEIGRLMKEIEDDENRRLANIDRAIEIAEKSLERIVANGNRPSRDAARHLAWQILRARISELIDLYNRLVEAERASSELPDSIQIEMHPLDPARTLQQVARTIETSNRPATPESTRIPEDRLPQLFPTDSQLSSGKIREELDLNYGRMVEGRLNRHKQRMKDKIRELTELQQTGIEDSDPRIKQLNQDIDWYRKRIATDSHRLGEMKAAEEKLKPVNKKPVVSSKLDGDQSEGKKKD